MNYVEFLFSFLGALKAVSGKTNDSNGDETIDELAVAGIKNVVKFVEVTVDLHSAVYIFHFVQALVKHVTVKEAYNTHVGEIDVVIFFDEFWHEFNK